MRDEQKGGGGLAVVLAAMALALICLLAVGSAWFFARSQAQKAMAAEKRAVELSIEAKAMKNRVEPEEATTPMD